MSVEKCSVCKELLPEKLPHSITVCSTNCFNKFWWKFYRSQMLAGGAFGAFLAWIYGRVGNVSGVAFISVCTTVFVMYKIKVMGDYPWE
jgi:hypothetical protein